MDKCRTMDEIIKQLKEEEYDYGVTTTTQAEIKAGAACGHLRLVVEDSEQ